MAVIESSESITVVYLLGLGLKISLKLLKQKLRYQVGFYGAVSS